MKPQWEEEPRVLPASVSALRPPQTLPYVPPSQARPPPPRTSSVFLAHLDWSCQGRFMGKDSIHRLGRSELSLRGTAGDSQSSVDLGTRISLTPLGQLALLAYLWLSDVVIPPH